VWGNHHRDDRTGARLRRPARPWRASVYTPRNTVYRDGARSYVDYQGKGLGIHEPGLRSFRIVSRDPHLL
jgi:hypothetical protein